MGKVSETITHTVVTEGVSDSAHKQWMTKKNNEISELNEQLDKSISASAHKQWMTKKDNEIAEKDQRIAELEAQLAEKNK